MHAVGGTGWLDGLDAPAHHHNFLSISDQRISSVAINSSGDWIAFGCSGLFSGPAVTVEQGESQGTLRPSSEGLQGSLGVPSASTAGLGLSQVSWTWPVPCPLPGSAALCLTLLSLSNG